MNQFPSTLPELKKIKLLMNSDPTKTLSTDSLSEIISSLHLSEFSCYYKIP